jgi:hypothetical protein
MKKVARPCSIDKMDIEFWQAITIEILINFNNKHYAREGVLLR